MSEPSARPSVAPSVSFQPSKSQEPSGAPSSSFRPTLETCNVEYSNGTVVTAQEFAAVSGGSVVYNSTDDRLTCRCRSWSNCDCQNKIIRNCNAVYCEEYYACESADFRGNTQVVCKKGVNTTGSETNICARAKFSNSEKVHCLETSSTCFTSTFENINELVCSTYAACGTSKMTNVRNMICSGSDYSCEESEITNVESLQCTGRSSCRRSNITGVSKSLVCSDQKACSEVDVTEIAENVPVECTEIGACYGARRIEKISSATGENITVTCQGQSACLNVTKMNVGQGTVTCEGEFEFDFQACINVSITAQCVACLNDKACGEGCQYQNSGSSSSSSCDINACQFFGTCSDTTCAATPGTTSGAVSPFSWHGSHDYNHGQFAVSSSAVLSWASILMVALHLMR